MRVVVLPDAETLAEAAASLVAEALREGAEGRVSLGLAGGSTPQTTYARLAQREIDWERVDLWLSDERWVPPDHPDSNGRMAEQTLAGQVPAVFHRPRWAEWLEPADSAAHYEAALRLLFPEADPHLVMLGMGDDGHTASLFPGSTSLEETSRWYVATHVAHLGAWRLTVTLPLLHSARRLMVLVAGASKAQRLSEVLSGASDLPAARLLAAKGELTWVVDEAAASRLSGIPLERPLG